MKRKRVYSVNMNLINKLKEYKDKGVSYIDALVELHLILDIEFEDFHEMLPDHIVEEIKLEFAKLNLTPKNDPINKELEKRESLEDIMKWID